MKTRVIKLATAYLILFLSILVPAQTGGNFTITESVIAGGGGTNSSGGNFSLAGTIGQSLAGNELVGGSFAVTSGFWNFTPSTPTAATASISGRVLTNTGRGLMNATVSMTDQSGNTRTTRTSTFGYYRFDEVAAGQTYVLNVSSKRYQFTPQIVTVTENLDEVNFVAQ